MKLHCEHKHENLPEKRGNTEKGRDYETKLLNAVRKSQEIKIIAN